MNTWDILNGNIDKNLLRLHDAQAQAEERGDKTFPCPVCGGKEARYQATITGGLEQHRVKCPDCGQRTPWFNCRHDAQLDWNGRFGKRDG